MGAPQYEQAGADVAGSGTTNTIPRWTGASTLGDSVISQDNGANRLLIDGGTAAAAANGTNVTIQAQNGGTGNTNGGNVILQPGALSGTGTAGFVRINGTGDVNLYLGNGTGPSAPYGIGQRVFSGQSHTAIFANAGYAAARASLGMVSGGVYTPALSADPSGNVGIGTASPASRLDVAGTITCDDAGTGLKLPATPGNADTQTLDCYAEGTWTPTLANFGGTNPTVTATYTRVGRLVTITVQIDATGGNQYSMAAGSTTITTPAGMTTATPAATRLLDSGVTDRGSVAVWTSGVVYLPTVALTTSSTFFVVTYRV